MTDGSADHDRLEPIVRSLGVGSLIFVVGDLCLHQFGSLAWSAGSPWLLGCASVWGSCAVTGVPSVKDGPVRRRAYMFLVYFGATLGLLALLFSSGVL